MLKQYEYYELDARLSYADAEPRLSYALLNNNNLNNENEPKPANLNNLRHEIFHSAAKIEDAASKTQQLLLFMGLANPSDEIPVANFTQQEAYEFLEQTTIGEDGWTPRMKLEKLQQGFEKGFSEETAYILKELQENKILARVHTKPKVTIGCKQAAEVRGIAPFQELKSLLFEVEVNGERQIAAFHMRGDEAVDAETTARLVKSKYGPGANIVTSNTDLHLAENLGLTPGRVNPLAIKYAAEKNGVVVKQFFSETIDKSIFDFPQEMFTNAASNFKGISFKWDSFKSAYSQNADFEFSQKFVGKTLDRSLYQPKTFGVLADDSVKFGQAMGDVIKGQMKELWGRRKLITPLLLSARARIEPLFRSGPTGYYDEENDAAVNRQLLQGGNKPELYIVGHNASLARKSLLETAGNLGIPDEQILFITDNVVSHLKAKGETNVQVITSSNFVRRWDEGSYSELGCGDIAISDERIDETIRFVDSASGDLSQKAGHFVDWFISESKAGNINLKADRLIVGSAEIERLLTADKGKSISRIEKELGVKLVMPLELAAQKVTETLYPKLHEEKAKRQAAEQEREAAKASRAPGV